MKSQYDQYDLFEHTDQFITRPKFHAERSTRFYPSEASIKLTDEFGDEVVYGNCLRASYFRLTGGFEGIPYDARAEFIFMQGKSVEEMLIEQWKAMGIWVDNNVKFYDAEHNISGELDAILREPDGTVYGAEVKSFYGYKAESEIFGNKSKLGRPKMSQLLQTLIYTYHFRDRLPYFRMVYFARDSVLRRTFKIELHEDHGLHYPKIEGVVWRQFTVEDILERYKLLQSYIEKQVIPPNDFELQYSDAKIEDYFKKGKISKSKYEDWQKSVRAVEKGKKNQPEIVGDWNCSYCSFKNVCWSKGMKKI